MLMDVIMILLSVLFGVLGSVFVFVTITDLRHRWARDLFLVGIIQLVVAIGTITSL